MSLTKLLAVGHSIMGLKRKAAPYRMARENWLPKFSPAGSVPVVEPKRTQPSGVSSPVGGACQVPSRPPPAAVQALNPPEPLGCAAAPEVAAAAAGVAAPPVQPVHLVQSLKQKTLGRLDLGWKQWMKSAAAAAMPKLGTRLHQPELDFGKVRVVRNDLRDSDVEIVADERVGGARAAKPASRSSPSSSAEASRVFGSTAARVKTGDLADIAG